MFDCARFSQSTSTGNWREDRKITYILIHYICLMNRGTNIKRPLLGNANDIAVM